MTTKELIEKLSKWPDDYIVSLYTDENTDGIAIEDLGPQQRYVEVIEITT